MIIRLPALLLLAVALAACEGSSDGTSASRDDVDDSTPADDSFDYFSLPDDRGERIDSEVLAFHRQTVVDGLNIPWGMAFLPDGIMLITERHGTLRLVRDGELESTPVGDTPAVFAQGQGGLLDIAAHPDYETNGWIYFTFSDPGDNGAHTALMRARLDLDEHRLVDREVLFSGIPKTNSTQHFGGRLVLDDSYMFVSSGDRGDMDEAQNLASHHGAIIRLHDDGGVPDENPFVDETDAQPETWTFGHRNVQGMAVRTETGEIWSHEHGPQGGDEINIIREGRNYGWPEITHGTGYDDTSISDETEREGMEQPVIHWTPSIAPSGMAFVSGANYPEWQDNLMVGALVGQELRRVELEGNEVIHQETLLQGSGRIRDVKMGPDGFLYLANESSGTIERLLPEE